MIVTTVSSATTDCQASAGSAGDNPNNMLFIAKPTPMPPARPIDEADRQQARRVARHEADDIDGARAEGHPRAELGGALRDRVRHHAEQPGRREHQREQREAGQHADDHVVARCRLRERLVERLQVFDRHRGARAATTVRTLETSAAGFCRIASTNANRRAAGSSGTQTRAGGAAVRSVFATSLDDADDARFDGALALRQRDAAADRPLDAAEIAARRLVW